MIYLDYASNTPACEEVLQTFHDVSLQYIANPNSSHSLGLAANTRLNESTKHIAELLGMNASEIIYTSGASESNNLAIKGAAEKYKKYGKHIITTYLEHSSVNGAIAALQNQGFEVDYVDITTDGRVEMNHLVELLRQDTILVSICLVDSEVGILQDIHAIGNLLRAYPHCCFHVDATQAVGKMPVVFGNVDLATFAPHKFYGLNGCGVLIKRESILLETQIHGGASTTPFRSGTPALALITSIDTALSLALADWEPRYKHVEALNHKLREGMKQFPKVLVNSTPHSIPYLFNISIPGVKTELIQTELGEQGIYVSTKSACCAPNTPSRPVYALTKDRKRALSTLRISLSHLTSAEDIDTFLNHFEDSYSKHTK